jgi:hypothetical protein
MPVAGAKRRSWSHDEGHRLATRGRCIDGGNARILYRRFATKRTPDLGCGVNGRPVSTGEVDECHHTRCCTRSYVSAFCYSTVHADIIVG